MKKTVSIPVMIYGASLMILGYLGYRHGSLASLYSGGGLGLILLLSSFAMLQHKKIGGYGALIATIIATATFSIRYSITGKDLTAILAVVSGGMLLFLLVQLGKWRKI